MLPCKDFITKSQRSQDMCLSCIYTPLSVKVFFFFFFFFFFANYFTPVYVDFRKRRPFVTTGGESLRTFANVIPLVHKC